MVSLKHELVKGMKDDGTKREGVIV